MSASIMLVVSFIGTLDVAPAAGAAGLSQFSGTVLDASGLPVANQTIDINDASGLLDYPVTTASDGTFTTTLASGDYTLQMYSQAPGNVYLQGTLDLSSSSITGVTIQLPTLATVVVTDSSGTPIPGATVTEQRTTTSTFCSSFVPFQFAPGMPVTNGYYRSVPAAVVPTDATGTAVVRGFSGSSRQFNYCTNGPGLLDSFEVSAPGYVTVYNVQAASLGVTVPVTLYRVGETETFSGTLEDQSGSPLVGTTLSFYGQAAGDQATTTVGADGSFSVELPPDNYSIQVKGVSADDQTPFQVSTGAIPVFHDLTDQSLVVPLEATTVQLDDSLGNPITGVPVTLRNPQCLTSSFQWTVDGTSYDVEASPSYPTVTSDASGQSTFDLPPCSQPGTNDLGSPGPDFYIDPPGTTNFPQEYVTGPGAITGPTTTNVVLASFSGSLVDSSGDDLAGQAVSVLTSGGTAVTSVSTDATGAFAVTVPPGTYTVQTSGTLGDPTTYSVRAAGVDLNEARHGALELPTGVENIQVEGPGGTVVPNASVAFACTSTAFTFLGSTAQGSECGSESTNSHGDAELEFLPTADAYLVVTPPAGSSLYSTSLKFTPTAGQTLTVTLNSTKVAPVITSTPVAVLPLGQAVDQQFSATGTPAPTFSATRLPPGLRVHRDLVRA
jgi:hypothetical protein